MTQEALLYAIRSKVWKWLVMLNETTSETYKWQCLGRAHAYIDMLEMLESTRIEQR